MGGWRADGGASAGSGRPRGVLSHDRARRPKREDVRRRAAPPAPAGRGRGRRRIDSGANPLTREPTFYGYGWGIEYGDDGRRALRHAGAFSLGARTIVGLLPDEGFGLVALANAFPTGVPDGLLSRLYDLVLVGDLTRDWIAEWNAGYETLGRSLCAAGEPYRTPPAAPTPPMPAPAYVGTCENAYAGPVEIAGQDGALTLRVGPERREFALTHFNHDTLTLAIDLEPPTWLTGANFIIGPDGRAASLHLDYFAGNRQGMFERRPGT